MSVRIRPSRARLVLSSALGAFSILAAASAEGVANAAEAPPALTITATRSPLALARAGSAITIISADDIAAYGAKSLADALRLTPGLDIVEQGGVGGLSNLSLRGSTPGQTLLLIDGVRIGDPASIAREFDLSVISVTDIARIEVLRGPQSALYGSDAMGGVVNIITKKGARAIKRSVSIEGGGYGTLSARGSMSGATDDTSYAFSLSGFHSDGFSRYGHRIRRIESTSANKLERDATDKLAGSARVVRRLGDGASVEIGATRFTSFVDLDNAGAYTLADKDTPFDRGRQRVSTIYGRTTADLLDGRFKNSLTLFSSWTDRFYRLRQSCYDAAFNPFDCRTDYSGRRVGAEYQGDLRLGSAGLLILGARTELETAENTEQPLDSLLATKTTFSGSQRTNSAFVLHQFSYGDRLDISLSGRVDVVDASNVFPTWRATAAYRLPEADAKLRGSVGTGAKAPSLFQRYSQWGDPSLSAEKSIGYDLGFDKSLLGGRATVSATWFDSWYRNLIDFDYLLNNGAGAYYNVGRARIRGLEFAGDMSFLEDAWRARASFTYMKAVDSLGDTPLLRRPRHKGALSLLYVGYPRLQIEGRAIFVGRRPDIENDWPYTRTPLPRYVRFDLRTSYAFDNGVEIFSRVENIGNARYEEVRDYGSSGRAFYAGLKVTW